MKIVEVPAAGVEKIHLKPEEWKVLSFTDGTMTIKEISPKANLSEFETSRILYGLISSGLVKIVPKAEKPKLEVPKFEVKVEKKEEKKVTKKEEKKKGDGLFGLFKKK